MKPIVQVKAKRIVRKWEGVVALAISLLWSIGDAEAAGFGLDGITSLLNNIIDWMNNGIIRAIGVLVLIFLLVLGREGHMEWKPVFIWMARIAGAFSAAFLIDMASGR
jgi:type IV secretory pathway VirB2 component (pilin)